MNINPQDCKSIRALILDMDGVLWLGAQPIGDLPGSFERIRKLGLKAILVTNNASRSTGFYLEKLLSFGVRLEAWQVLSSGQALVYHLQKDHAECTDLYVIGEQALVDVLVQAGYRISEQEAQAVIVSLDRDLTYEKLRTATRLVRSGAALIATNFDPTIPTPTGLGPGAGAILAAVEASTGVSATIAGKPNPQSYQLALERLGCSAGQTLVIGDRLETDIAGAQSLGCRTALVLSGVTSQEAARSWLPPPDLIARDLEQVLETLSRD
jgi:4-nitrophenyl phosphatase